MCGCGGGCAEDGGRGGEGRGGQSGVRVRGCVHEYTLWDGQSSTGFCEGRSVRSEAPRLFDVVWGGTQHRQQSAGVTQRTVLRRAGTATLSRIRRTHTHTHTHTNPQRERGRAVESTTLVHGGAATHSVVSHSVHLTRATYCERGRGRGEACECACVCVWAEAARQRAERYLDPHPPTHTQTHTTPRRCYALHSPSHTHNTIRLPPVRSQRAVTKRLTLSHLHPYRSVALTSPVKSSGVGAYETVNTKSLSHNHAPTATPRTTQLLP